MGLDISAPFAQALIAEGRKRGYNDYDIAGSIGNAYAENKLNTSGLPGDKGTAFGGMQWRQDRFDALKAKAAEAGVPWTDPNVQAAHWFDEQDADGNKGAKSVTDANDNSIGSLRPAGYHADTPDNLGVSAYANRLQGTNDAYAAITGASPGVMSPEPGVMSQQTPPQLTSAGFTPGSRQDWGNWMTGLGAELRRRDNPEAAAQMDAGLQKQIENQQAFLKAQQASNSFKSGTPFKNAAGNWVTTQTSSNGQVNTVPTPKDQIPDETSDDRPTASDVKYGKQFNDASANMALVEAPIDQLHTIQEALQAGKVHLGPGQTMTAFLDNLTNNSTEQDRLLKSGDSAIITAATSLMSVLKGTGTNFKFKKEMENVMPLGAMYDDKAAYDGFGRVADGLQKIYGVNAQSARNAAGGAPKTLGKIFDPKTSQEVDTKKYHMDKESAMAARVQALKDGEVAFKNRPPPGSEQKPTSFLSGLPKR